LNRARNRRCCRCRDRATPAEAEDLERDRAVIVEFGDKSLLAGLRVARQAAVAEALAPRLVERPDDSARQHDARDPAWRQALRERHVGSLFSGPRCLDPKPATGLDFPLPDSLGEPVEFLTPGTDDGRFDDVVVSGGRRL